MLLKVPGIRHLSNDWIDSRTLITLKSLGEIGTVDWISIFKKNGVIYLDARCPQLSKMRSIDLEKDQVSQMYSYDLKKSVGEIYIDMILENAGEFTERQVLGIAMFAERHGGSHFLSSSYRNLFYTQEHVFNFVFDEDTSGWWVYTLRRGPNRWLRGDRIFRQFEDAPTVGA